MYRNECACKNGSDTVNCPVHKKQGHTNYWFDEENQENGSDEENQ